MTENFPLYLIIMLPLLGAALNLLLGRRFGNTFVSLVATSAVPCVDQPAATVPTAANSPKRQSQPMALMLARSSGSAARRIAKIIWAESANLTNTHQAFRPERHLLSSGMRESRSFLI